MGGTPGYAALATGLALLWRTGRHGIVRQASLCRTPGDPLTSEPAPAAVLPRATTART